LCVGTVEVVPTPDPSPPLPDLPDHLAFGAFSQWPGGRSRPAPGFGVDDEHDVAWLRTSSRPVSDLTIVHRASVGDGDVVLQVAGDFRLVALGVTNASRMLPAGWMLAPPPSVEMSWDEALDIVELAFVPPAPGIEVCGVEVSPRDVLWAVTVLIEPSGLLAAIQVFPARAALDLPAAGLGAG
jgi:hypothetical protein